MLFLQCGRSLIPTILYQHFGSTPSLPSSASQFTRPTVFRDSRKGQSATCLLALSTRVWSPKRLQEGSAAQSTRWEGRRRISAAITFDGLVQSPFRVRQEGIGFGSLLFGPAHIGVVQNRQSPPAQTGLTLDSLAIVPTCPNDAVQVDSILSQIGIEKGKPHGPIWFWVRQLHHARHSDATTALISPQLEPWHSSIGSRVNIPHLSHPRPALVGFGKRRYLWNNTWMGHCSPVGPTGVDVSEQTRYADA